MMQTRHFRHSRHSLLVLLLWTMPAWATTYYVSQGATGSGCSTTDSPSTNRSTINSGIQCLGSGDTLVVNNGMYQEQVNLDNVPSGGGSYAAATRIMAKNPRQPRIVPHGGESECCAFVGSANRNAWIIVEGFDVGGSPSSYTSPVTPGGVLLPGPNGTQRVRFLNNKFHHIYNNAIHDYSDRNEYIGNEITVVGTQLGGNSGHPFYINGVGHLIEGNYIHHCRDADGGAPDWTCYAIHARFIETIPTSGWIVRNNRIEFAEEGILIVGSDMQVYNNVLTGMTNNAIWNHAWGSTVYYGNTIAQNNGCAFYANTGASPVSATARNNILYGNGNNTLSGCLAAGTLSGTPNLINTNPNFVGGGDFHVQAGSPAINFGANLGAPYNVDIEGRTRPTNEVTAGAYQYGVTVPPEPVTPGTIAWYKGNLNAQDSIATNHGTLTNGALANGAPLVEGNSFVFDGVDARVSVPATSALRPAAVGLSLWMKSTTPPTAVGYCHALSMGHAWTLGWGDDQKAFCWVNFGPTAAMTTGNVLDGQPHMLSCAYDPAGAAPGVRLWLGNTQVAFTPYSAPISYTGSEALSIGDSPDGAPCAGLVDQVRIANYAWSQADINAMFTEQVPVQGTSMTQSQWERANKAIGDVMAINVDLPAYDRTQAVALAVAIQRVGSTITQYFALECSKNGGAYTALTNLFGTLGARIAPDSVLNMGDSVPVSLPTGGLTGVAGRVVANTINTSFTTTLDNNQQTQWRYTLDFGGPAVSGDTFDCRPVGLDSYANVKRITLADPSVFLGIKGSQLKGFQFR